MAVLVAIEILYSVPSEPSHGSPLHDLADFHLFQSPSASSVPCCSDLVHKS